MNGLHILGTGRALPANIVTNDDLVLRVETSDEWIVSRTGIRERRFATHETLTQLAVEAARAALERAGVSPQELGLCLTATVSPDCATPSQACLIHQALHLPEDCPAFDLSAGCTGFLYAMETSAALLPRMARPYALLVGGELLSRITDMDDRSTCIIFGDGVGAAVVKADPDAPWFARLGARGCREVLWAPGPGQAEHPYLHMNGQEVYKFAVSRATEDLRALCAERGMELSEVGHFLLHQANLRILEAVRTRLKQPKEKFPHNVELHGNTSSAGIAILLDELNRSGALQKGEYLAMSAFGAGLTSGACILKWE